MNARPNNSSNTFKDRWRDPAFLASIRTSLDDLFIKKQLEGHVDLRGLIVGADGGLEELQDKNLHGVRLVGADLSYSKFSCPFSHCQISATTFDSADFDTCGMKKARFEECSFKKSRIASPTLEDALFVACEFSSTRINGRGWREYGAKRSVFERCRFNNVVFRNLQIRAGRFTDCVFESVAFEKCLVSGTTFSGNLATTISFVDCELTQSSVTEGTLS